jgi:hypothetical protein
MEPATTPDNTPAAPINAAKICGVIVAITPIMRGPTERVQYRSHPRPALGRTARPLQGPPFIALSERVIMYSIDDVRAWLASRRVTPEAA